jgi:excisionase family DNA binding protein
METFLTVEEIAGKLRVSRVWIYKLVREKRIPFFRLDGKCVRFSPTEINQWLEEGREKAWHRDKN